MKLRTYLDGLPRGGITEFAGVIGISSVYLSQLAAEQDGRVPSPELCLTIETATKRTVTRQELRPNDFWKIWPDLAHLAPGPDLSAINLDATDQERREAERRERERRAASNEKVGAK